MTSPARDPLHDAARLKEIADLGLLSTDVDPILQDVATRAAAQLQLPMSVVSIVLDEAQHVAAAHGVDGRWLDETRGLPVEWSFCATSVRTREAYVVENASADPVQRANPMVTQEGVRCYAGVPLVSSRGFVLGNLCVVGMEERTFSEDDMATLRGLAVEAVRRIEGGRTD
ncbi:MAG TPA: GAF domain-containing protein [Gemmatimonadaceae bacterium]|nr:GAF domain-containing protein [Gemmatimonadaceae bacterium]